MLSLLRERSEFLSEYFFTQKTVIELPGLVVPGEYSLRQSSLFTWNNGVYRAIFTDVRSSGQGARC